ncbi:MAG: EF-hand domain-containing protein [Paracoccaceae bacterium]|nr:EF-hand domain-containing protein [Paracoccaceae bacterium]
MENATLKILLATTLIVVGGSAALAKGGERMALNFEELDADGSGEITTEDFATLRDNRFGELDADGDGSITKEEFTAASAARASERAEAMFDRLDADGDGVLSRDVIESQGRGGDRMGSRMIERFDADNSGGISAGEFEEAQARFGERRKGGKRGHGWRN